MPRDKAKAPYSSQELGGYLALADAQRSALRRQRANALICLGAGAGPIGGELRGVSGADVVRRSGGVLVLVDGRRPRAVPVLSDYHERLCACRVLLRCATSSLATTPTATTSPPVETAMALLGAGASR